MRSYRYFVATSAVAAFLGFPSALWAQGVAPDLGAAAPFAVLGLNSTPTPATVTCTDTGPGIAINGQVGTTAGGITNVGPCTITGPIVAPVAGGVVTAFNSAFTAIDIQNPVCTGVIPIVSTTLPPGVYCSPAGTTIGTGVTLTLSGNASDVWVFRVGTTGPGALTITGGSVVMGGAALACNVYWKTSAATTLTDATFNGTVLSGSAVTMTRTNWVGRALARTDATLTDPIPMTFAGCAAGAQPAGCPVLTLSPTVLANGSVGTAYSQTVTLTGGATAPSVFSVLPTATLPVGLTLSTGGVLSGTPTTAVPQTFTIRGNDSLGCFAQRTFTVFIVDGTPPVAGCPVITLSPTTIPNGAVGVAYSQQITAAGGAGTVTFTRTAGSSIPPGLTLSTGGLISGTPTVSLFPDSFTLRATDANGCFVELPYTIAILAGVPTLPQTFVIVMFLGLLLIGYAQLRNRRRA